MFKKGDFHIHTNYSDGKYSPSEIIDLSKLAGMDIIAITDHDTVSAINEASEYGINKNIKVIPGIEMSTTKNGENIHVIGYFFSQSKITEDFKDFLENRHNERIKRAEEIINRLDKYFSIKIDKYKLLENTKGIIGRPHIAIAIQDAGYNYSWTDIFKSFLSEDSIAYVPNKRLHTEEALEILNSMNAIKILAHPVLVKLNSIIELLNLGFDGLEAVYHLNSKEKTDEFRNLAKELNLIVTGGSDFHGIHKTDFSHSDEIGSVFLQEKEINIFLNALKKGV